MEKVDLLIENVNVFNSYLKKFKRADVSVLDGKFFYIDTEKTGDVVADVKIDGTGFSMIPGFIDIHMHIESSMITPQTFGERVAACGVTTIVSEPHEMANVKGVRGVHEMINAAKDAPIDIYYGIPSSVPSTNPGLETTGGTIDLEGMKQLLLEKDVICVGEIMNYREIIKENSLEITKFLDYLKQEKPEFVIEGHCPSLKGIDLAKFLYLGIDADHTEHDLEEVKQRLENGMFLEIQDKTLKPEILTYIRENRLYEHCAFVTDDTMADKLYQEGQLNKVIEKAIEAGFPLEEAIYCGTYTPARRMNLKDRGSIAPGRKADFMLLSDVKIIEPSMVFKDGSCIYDNKPNTVSQRERYQFPPDFYQSVHVKEIEESLFEVVVERDVTEVEVRVIEVLSDRTQTKEKHVTMPVENGRVMWQQSGCQLVVVIERHGKNGNIGYGFLGGSCMKEGAAASTCVHDHHNLMIAGSSPKEMQLAAQRVLSFGGGMAVVKDGKVLAELALPVGGILSEESTEEVGKKVGLIRESMLACGYCHYNPIMSFATLGLPVSPALKLTDMGLIHVAEGCKLSLFL